MSIIDVFALQNEEHRANGATGNQEPLGWTREQEALLTAPRPPERAIELEEVERWLDEYRRWWEGPRQGARLKLWTPEDLAAYLDIDLSWVYDRTRRRGKDALPHLKLGKYIRFNPKSPDFLDWLERHTK